MPWGALPAGAEVLLIGPGTTTPAVSKALQRARLTPRMWHRFAGAALDDAAAAWPPLPTGGRGYAAVVLRLPPTRAAFEMA